MAEEVAGPPGWQVQLEALEQRQNARLANMKQVIENLDADRDKLRHERDGYYATLAEVNRILITRYDTAGDMLEAWETLRGLVGKAVG